MAYRPIDPRLTNAFMDSCAFDPAEADEEKAAREIDRLFQEHDRMLTIAHSTLREIDHPNTPADKKRRAQMGIRSIDVQLTAPERQMQNEILRILTGNGKEEKYAADAQHVFEAQKYGSYFITVDQRILDKGPALRELCGVTICRPTEFLKILRDRIAEDVRS